MFLAKESEQRAGEHGRGEGHDDEHGEDAGREDAQIVADIERDQFHQPAGIHQRPELERLGPTEARKPGGDRAAQIVVDSLPPRLRKSLRGLSTLADTRVSEGITTVLAELSSEVRQEGLLQPHMSGMGTTIVFALVWERQAIIAELAGAAAHELNKPLTSVMGYSELLKRRLEPETAPYAAAEVIFNEAERMVNRGGRICLAAFPGKPAEVDIAYIVRNNIYVYGIRGEGKSATHRAEAFMAQKRFDATKVHTHTFALEDLPTALKYARERIEDAIKVVVKTHGHAALNRVAAE